MRQAEISSKVHGNFEAKTTVLLSSKMKLTWWKNNIMTVTKSQNKVSVDATVYTNANLESLGYSVWQVQNRKDMA